MKFLLIAAFVAVATANPARLIVPGPAGPAPVIDAPVIVEESESPISVGPVIVDEIDSNISVGPVIIDNSDYSPISVGPAIIDQVPEPSISSPLVQVIINVKSGSAVVESPVVIEDHESSPAIVEPSPVIVVDNVEDIVEQPIINAPVFPSPVVVLPEALN